MRVTTTENKDDDDVLPRDPVASAPFVPRTVEAVLMEAGKPNKSGNIYPRGTLEKISKSVLPILGELNPLAGAVGGSRVRFDLVSHQVTDLQVRDDKLVATIVTLDTPAGRVLSQVLEKSEFYSIGTGRVDEAGLVSEYNLISVGVDSKPPVTKLTLNK